MSESVPVEDALDILQMTQMALIKGSQGEGEPYSPNPASKHLRKYVEESYDIMAESLAKEIAKVFAEGEADKGR